MIKSNNTKHKGRVRPAKYKRIASAGLKSKGIINDLYDPIDATNRFINLALQGIDEGSQSRQFLLESKEGIRKTAFLLNKLNNYAKTMEKELRGMMEEDERNKRINIEQ